MDPIIAKMLKERDNLRSRLKEIELALRVYEQFLKPEQGDAASLGPVDSGDSSIHEPTHERPLQRPREREVSMRPSRRGPHAVRDEAITILHEHGRPLTRGELANELQMRRVELPGKDDENKARYVGTIMWRNRENWFEHVEGKGYWLKGEPIPETEKEKQELRLRNRLI